ncbi:hypothetical protein MPER_10693, partial [Moniliophthora perniciosa FA553]
CHIPAPEFKPGDKVWLDASDIKTDCPSRKLADRNLGPFVVERCVGFGAYKLKLPATMKRLHPVFPVVKLTAYTPDPIPGQAPKPPPAPVVIEGEKYYKTETIIDAKYRWQSLWYLCKFEGYRAPEWVRYDDLNEAQEKLDEFYHCVPGAPCRVVQAIFTSLPFQDRKAEQTSNWRERQSAPLSRRGRVTYCTMGLAVVTSGFCTIEYPIPNAIVLIYFGSPTARLAPELQEAFQPEACPSL